MLIFFFILTFFLKKIHNLKKYIVYKNEKENITNKT